MATLEMGHPATDLADRFHQTRQAFLDTIESFTPNQMDARCVAEQCTVSALASHMACVYQITRTWIQAIVRGEALPNITMDDIDRRNHEQFARDAHRDRGAIIPELRTTGERVEQIVRVLGGPDLDRTIEFSLFGGQATTQQLVENALIGHTESHLASVLAAGVAKVGEASGRGSPADLATCG
jgi:hypothetical protein